MVSTKAIQIMRLSEISDNSDVHNYFKNAPKDILLQLVINYGKVT